jgi:hypothetical protein
MLQGIRMTLPSTGIPKMAGRLERTLAKLGAVLALMRGLLFGGLSFVWEH